MGQTIFGVVAPKRSIPVYIMKKFDFKEMLEAVQKYRISTLTMVPPVVVVRIPRAFIWDETSAYEKIYSYW